MADKYLVLAEKPSVARSIAEALGGFVKRDNYLESPDYLLTWAIGHLVDHGRPEDYDPKYAKWQLEDLPIIPETWKVFPRSKDSKKQLDVIAELAKRAKGFILATDAGREGELIGRSIARYLNIRLPMQRLWISSLTKEAIQKGFANLRPGKEFDNLYASAEVRARGDWLVGLNATRAFTLRFREGEEGVLSVGRVQTPTLAILVRRELEIRSFKPEDYYMIRATLTARDITFQARWQGPDGVDRLKDKAEAEALAEKIADAGMAVVREAKIQNEQEGQPQLYDLTTLQREANKRYRMTAQQTLDAAQALYEAKLITYPRTDSRYLTKDLLGELPGIMANVTSQPDYEAFKTKVNLSHFRRSSVVNDAKVSDHHAIIPTNVKPTAPLEGHQQKVYDLIVRRFIANGLPPAVDHTVRLVLDAAGETLIASGKQEVEPGWRIAEPKPSPATKSKGREKGDSDEEDITSGPVPELEVDENAFVDGAEVLKKTTKPPRRLNEAGLLSAMENAGKDIDDAELKEVMKGRGLGTPATRAAIIERLKQVGYIVQEGPVLVPTPKGIRLIRLVEQVGVEKLASPELTADWELRLERVAEGKEDPRELMEDLKAYTAEIMELVKRAESIPSAGALEMPPCPICGSPALLERFSVRCSREGCTLKISRTILGRELAHEDLADLLVRRRTVVLGGFVSARTGREFAAALVLKPDGSGVEFDFKAEGEPKDPPAPSGSTSSGSRRGGTGGGRSRGGSGSRSGSSPGRGSPPSRSSAAGGPTPKKDGWGKPPSGRSALARTGISERR